MKKRTPADIRAARLHDTEYFERELDSFVPDRIFDAHCHVWQKADEQIPPLMPATVGHGEYVEVIRDIHRDRPTCAMFIPMPTTTDDSAITAANAWTSQAAHAAPDFRGLFFVKPQHDPEWVRSEVRRLKLHGLKCYHTMADVTPTWQAEIPDYLPEPLVKVAHEEGWVITLHMVRQRACADPSNIKWIRHYCRTYPNMTLILAHSARGFQPQHNLEGLPKLTGLDNLYFDTSANCDAMAHQAIIRIIGHKRLMYGTDMPVSHLRGRSVPVGDTFVWLYEQTPIWKEKHTQIDPPLVGLEHLRSLKWACWSEKLKDSDVEDIFYNNAARLFRI